MKKRLLAICFILLLFAAQGCFASRSDTKKIKYIVATYGEEDIVPQIKSTLDALKNQYNLSYSIVNTTIQNIDAKISAAFVEGCDFILVTSSSTYELVRAYVSKYPEQNVIYLGGKDEYLDTMSYEFHVKQTGFLAGALAAYVSESGVVGYIGGFEDENNEYLDGYILGTKSVNAGITVLQAYIKSYNAFTPAYEAALEMGERGADVIFSNCGASALGIQQAAVERGFYIINSEMYRLSDSSKLFAVLNKHYDTAMRIILEDFYSGHFSKDINWIGLESKVVSIEFSQLASEDARAQVEQYREAIINGQIAVPN